MLRSEKVSDLKKQHSALLAVREEFDVDYKELSEFNAPTRSYFEETHGDRKNRRDAIPSIYDNTGRIALRTAAAGMTSGATSAARPWFKLTTPDRELAKFGPVKEWLFSVERLMREIYSRSNLYTILPGLYEEVLNFGIGALTIQPNFDRVIHVYGHTVGEYCIADDDLQVTDTSFRIIKFTVIQLVGKFGLSKVSQQVKDAYEKGAYYNCVDVVHVIKPRGPRQDTGLSVDMPYMSIYYEFRASDIQPPLSISGYHEFPSAFPRWDALGNSAYGTDCPGMMAKPDVRSLQFQELEKQTAIAKKVHPPMSAHPSLQDTAKSLVPGGVTFTDFSAGGTPLFQPTHNVNLDIRELEDTMVQTRERINTAFFADLFQMMIQSDRRQITATEVAERHEEKLLMLGPVLERLHTELLDRIIDRTFAIAERAGILPPAPEELQETELEVEYVSILAQAQKAVSTTGIERITGFVAQAMQIKPDVADKLDMDQAVDDYADAIGVSPKTVVPDDEVDALREQRAQQQQQQAALETAQQGADIASTASDIDGDSGVAEAIGLDSGSLGVV